jgi:signal transduction histidine kinase
MVGSSKDKTLARRLMSAIANRLKAEEGAKRRLPPRALRPPHKIEISHHFDWYISLGARGNGLSGRFAVGSKMRDIKALRLAGLWPRSIVAWFTICWAAFLVASVLVGALLWSLYRQSTTEQLRRATAGVVYGCDNIAASYRAAARTIGEPVRATELTAVVRSALRQLDGVEGGVWSKDQGSLAYAFPTYEGTSEKTDVPQAEEASIREAAEFAGLHGVPYDRRSEGRAQTLLLRGCPIISAQPGLVAWTMTRFATIGGRAYGQAMAGLGILMAVVLGSAALLGGVLLGWSRRLRSLEIALASSLDELPLLATTGQRDLDRIVDAINRAGVRLAEARAAAAALRDEMAEAKRLATLGRVVAGVAHEIRNPIAAMRLKAENAIAAGPDSSRKDGALTAIIEQIGRLEALLKNLLSSVQHALPHPMLVRDIHAFLAKRAELFHEQAAAQQVVIEIRSCSEQAMFDEKRVAQAIDNLILNAIQNSPGSGYIRLSAERVDSWLHFSVADTGHGVSKDMRDHLFEPFATDRPEGTGLGLAIVREIAEAHGGAARVVHRTDGTTFILELPWRSS